MKMISRFTGITTMLAILSSFVSLPVTAKAVNEYSISNETLTESIVTEGGNCIPAGSIAVTMSIDNNAGFSSNMFLLNIADSYEVIVGEDNKPIIETGSALTGFLTAASADNGKLCVAVASAETHRGDGALFTFYCTTNKETTDKPATIGEYVDPSVFETSDADNNHFVNNRNQVWVIFGDVNGNGVINSWDASEVLRAVDINNDNIILCTYLYMYPDNIITYFPYCYTSTNPYCYLAADTYTPPYTGLYYVDNEDAQEILEYAACMGTGPNSYTGPGRFGPVLFDLSLLG